MGWVGESSIVGPGRWAGWDGLACSDSSKAIFRPNGEASGLSKQWMSLSISWIIFLKSPRFENFSEESSSKLSKVSWCAKTASSASSEPCFSVFTVADLGGWGEVSADGWCSLAVELGGFGSLEWVPMLCFFFLKKP